MLFRGDMKHLNIIDFEQLDGIRVNNSDVFEGFVSIFYSKFYFGAIWNTQILLIVTSQRLDGTLGKCCDVFK